MDAYNTCPRKFQYKYITKAPKKPQNMEPLLKGGAVHHILEHYPAPSSHSLAPKYQHIADKFLATSLGQRLMFRESTREYDLGLTKDLLPCKYSDNAAMFRGSVDYIFTDNSVLNLVDWKTGKYRDQRWQSYNQLMFYAVYFFIKYPTVNTINVCYVYVEHTNSFNDLKLEREHLNRYKLKLVQNIAEIEAATDYPKTTKNVKLCPWCEYESYCLTDV